jgi:xanthine dehydrogenase small subunit
MRYRSLNSCLTFVSSLHGKQLISVEDLKHQGQLHSVQQAMAECHGSQCGFCTPGFRHVAVRPAKEQQRP